MSPDVQRLNPGLELTGTMKKHKYNATRTERLWKGILWKFDSKAEARRFDALTAMQEAGEVQFFLVQVPFRLPETTYRVDFVVWWKDGHVTFEDVKGRMTPKSKLKIDQVRRIHGIDITIIR